MNQEPPRAMVGESLGLSRREDVNGEMAELPDISASFATILIMWAITAPKPRSRRKSQPA